VHVSVLESVLFFVFKHDAVLINKVHNGVLPDRGLQVFDHDVENPLLNLKNR